MLRLLYVGNHKDDWRTESHITAALREWNHKVITHQLSTSSIRQLPALIRRHRPDILLWTHTSHLAPDNRIARHALEAVKALGVVTAAVHLDRYWDLARESAITTEPWMTGCDVVFTADGGNQQRFQDAGVNHIWLAPAVHGPDTELVGTPQDKYRAKVAFVGSWQNYHPEWPWRLEMIDLLRERYGDNFRTFPDNPRRPIRGQQLSDLYASVDVVVGDSCFAGTSKGDLYHSDRIYETIGRGGVLAFPYVRGLEDSFVDGKHLRYFHAQDSPSMFKVVDELLSDPAQREHLRTEGRTEIRTNHLYRHRVSEMVRHIAEYRCSLVGWTAEVRPHTYDATTIRETWMDDVYRAKGHINPGDTVVDLGGNVGVFAIWAALQGADVISVEPLPANREQFCRNAHAMGVGDKITIIPSAVGEKEGSINMSFFDTDGSQSCYRIDSGEVRVPVTRLENILPHREIAFLKVDIEGSEIHALKDADLSRVRRIAIETHNTMDPGTTHERVKVIVKAAGFEVTETGGHKEGYVFGVKP